MSGRERRKGVAGEREVAAILAAHGWIVRGLEGQGDHLAIRERLVTMPGGDLHAHLLREALHVEVKRQERLQLWQWVAQADAEAPPGTVPVVAFRRSRDEWRACLSLADLLRLIG